MPVLIQTVAPGSHAARAGVRPGDTLLTIGGRPINDVLDYRFYMTDRQLELSLLRGGAPYSVRIKKAEYDDIGLDFERQPAFLPLRELYHAHQLDGCGY